MSQGDFDRERGFGYEEERRDFGEGYPQRPNIPTYLAQAILCTLFCCLPFGIVAIIQAAQVNGKLSAGDYAAAQKASAERRNGAGFPSFVA